MEDNYWTWRQNMVRALLKAHCIEAVLQPMDVNVPFEKNLNIEAFHILVHPLRFEDKIRVVFNGNITLAYKLWKKLEEEFDPCVPKDASCPQFNGIDNHQDEDAVLKYDFPELNEENYSVWQQQVRAVLDEHECLSSIKTYHNVLDSPATLRNDKAVMIILNSLSYKQYLRYSLVLSEIFNSACLLWLNISEDFIPKQACDVISLPEKLFELQIYSGEVGEQLGEIQQLFNDWSDATQTTISPQMKVSWILSMLDPEVDYFFDIKAEYSFEEVYTEATVNQLIADLVELDQRALSGELLKEETSWRIEPVDNLLPEIPEKPLDLTPIFSPIKKELTWKRRNPADVVEEPVKVVEWSTKQYENQADQSQEEFDWGRPHEENPSSDYEEEYPLDDYQEFRSRNQ